MSLQCQVDLQHHPSLFGVPQSQNLYLLVSRPQLAWQVLSDDFVVFEMVPLREPHRANLQDSPRGHCFLSCFSVFCWCRNRGGPRTRQRSQSHAGVIKTAVFQHRRYRKTAVLRNGRLCTAEFPRKREFRDPESLFRYQQHRTMVDTDWQGFVLIDPVDNRRG